MSRVAQSELDSVEVKRLSSEVCKDDSPETLSVKMGIVQPNSESMGLPLRPETDEEEIDNSSTM